MKFLLQDKKMTAIAKSAKTHPAAKKCCGWEEPAIYVYSTASNTVKEPSIFASANAKYLKGTCGS